MTVATFTQPDRSTQNGVQYTANIDAALAVLAALAQNFAAHQAATPDMTVVIDAGKVWNGSGLISQAAQTTSAIPAPTTNPRIDRIAIDTSDGSYVRIAGTEAASPSAPAYADGQYPVCQISLSVAQTEIINANITDERPLIHGGGGQQAQFVTRSDYHTISNTQLTESSFTDGASFVSVGPTDGGADVVWSALDALPADIDWIEVRIRLTDTNSGSPTQGGIVMHSRPNGSLSGTGTGALTEIARAFVGVAGAGATSLTVVNTVATKLKVTDRKFEMYYSSISGSGGFHMVVTGYGYN